MKKSQMIEFSSGVVASVLVGGEDDFADIGKLGKIVAPEGKRPQGFHLQVQIEKGSRAIVVQRDLRHIASEYHTGALSDVNVTEGFDAVVMRNAIQVVYEKNRAWTDWRSERPNRLDIWFVRKDGSVGLFQVGVVTPDNGKTWVIVGEWRWKGRLFLTGDGKIVGEPEDAKFGNFDVRRTILDHSEFNALLESAKLAKWKGSDRGWEVPPLKFADNFGKSAVIDWWTPFMGRQGQGIAKLSNGTSVWVMGDKLVGADPDEDGIVRLHRGDVVNYEFDEVINGETHRLVNPTLVERAA